jgi:hypothetical protein
MATKAKGSVRARKAAAGGGKELARLRKIIGEIDGVMEKLSHGEPTWFTGEKGRVFAMFDNHHHGAEHVSVYFATPHEVQEALVAEEPERYWVPPYVGHSGWVAVILSRSPDWPAVKRLAKLAHTQIAAKGKR